MPVDPNTRNIELAALLEVSKALTSSFDLEANLARALEALSDLLGMRRATVTLADPETRELRIAVAHGLTRNEISRGKYRIGEGVVGRVVESGRPMVVPDTREEPLFLNRTRSRIDRDHVAFVCVPVRLPGEIFGVLSADRIFAEDTSLAEDVRVLEVVASLIAQAVKLTRAFQDERRRVERLTGELKGRYSLRGVVGESDVMREVSRVVGKVAKSTATVLLRGESGTGKELIAKAIHYEGVRASGPFVAVNCAALPENLLEAELFGFEKGAFTGAAALKKGRFELAHAGTIFLDEIGDVSPALQAKLLRVLQERTFERLGGTKTIKVNTRIVSATNRDLEAMVRDGTFREDLYWRLNVVPVFLPALRERAEDVPLLIEHFLARFSREQHRNTGIEPRAMKVLMAYRWPGNIREMENTIQRLTVLAEDDLIRVSDLPVHLLVDEPAEDTGSLSGEVASIERTRIVDALIDSGGIHTRAARALGITPRQLRYRVRKYGIDPEALLAR